MLWRHILGYLPVNAIQGLVSFATIVLFTRLLDPDDYGRYVLVLATTQLVHMSCFTWLHASMARFFETARGEGRLAVHFATGYAAFFVVAAVVSAAYLAIVFAIDFSGPVRAALLFGLLMLLLRTLLMMGLETHRAAQQVRLFAGLEVTQSLLGLGAGVALIMGTGLREAGPFLGAAIASAVCLAIDLPILARLAGRASPSASELRRFAAYGVPISISLALAMAFGVSDRFLIAAMLGESEVGVYAAGYALANRTMDILFVWLGMAGMPLVVAAFEREGDDAAREIARRNAEIMILIAFPAAAGLAVVAEPLTAVMVGEQFRTTAAAIVPWIAFSSLMFGFTGHYVHLSFVLSRRTELMAAMLIVPAVANVGLNLVLIPRFGLVGAVIATVIAYALALGLCGFVGMRLFPLPVPYRTLARGTAATAVMALAVWLVPAEPGALGLCEKVATGVLVYAPLAWLLDLGGCREWLAGAGRRFAIRSSKA